MRRKVTLTVDEEVLPRAKAEARRRGVSLSRMVEEMLREATPGGGPSFSEEWRGRLHLDAPDDVRARSLLERYG